MSLSLYLDRWRSQLATIDVSNVNELPEGAGDAELIARVRAGDRAAYGSLYERHVGAAQACARAMVRNRTDADDLVNEAFTRVLNAMKNNGGPEIAFRPYLLASVRNVAYDRARKNKRVDVVEDVDRVAPLDVLSSEIDFGADAERSIIAAAYATLPERWRMVLWHTEVEGMNPADVAPLLGIAPNAVAALAYRAREGLRQAYLQAHVLESSDADCQWVIHRLSAFARDRLPTRERVTVESHLDQCEDCRARYAEISHVNSALQFGLLPLVVGPTAAAGYLKLLAAQTAHAAGFGAVVRHGSQRAIRSMRSNSTATVGVAAAVAIAVAAAAALSGDGGTKPQTQATSASSSTQSPSRDAAKQSNPVAPDQAVEAPPAAAPSSSVPVETVAAIAPPPSTSVPAASTTSAAPVTPTETTSAPSSAPTPSTTSVPAPVTFDASVSVVAIGEQVLNRPGAFSVSVSNAGAGTASNASVVISVPGTTTLAAKTASGTCGVTAPTVTCTFSTIAAGTAADVLVSYTTGLPSISVNASVAAAGDSNAANNAQALNLAQAADGVSPTFVALDHGDFVQTGNSLMSCDTASFGCAAAQARGGTSLSNNSWAMKNIDVDSDASTFNSSSAELSIPPGSSVLWAGLYWGADTTAGGLGIAAPEASKADLVTLTSPVASHSLTAGVMFRDASRTSRYQGFADVTSIVTAEGSGTYTIGNVQTGTGLDRYAGWALVVAYRNDSLPLRSLYAFDGLRVVSSGAPIDVRISGFTYATGKRASLGVLAYEGDAGVTGDGFTVNGVAVSDGANPVDDLFNSTSSLFGSSRLDRAPADTNTFGFDADMFDISSALANGVDHADLQYRSTGDRYLVGSVTVAVDR